MRKLGDQNLVSVTNLELRDLQFVPGYTVDKTYYSNAVNQKIYLLQTDESSFKAFIDEMSKLAESI